MADPFLGEIRIFAFGAIPDGWAPCEGQLLWIDDYPELYFVIRTWFGGDGVTTFALPDLRRRTPMHAGAAPLGRRTTAPTETLSEGQSPEHNHPVQGGTVQESSEPADAFPGPTEEATYNASSTPTRLVAMGADTIVPFEGGAEPHDNMQPYLSLNMCIAYQGTFLPPN